MPTFQRPRFAWHLRKRTLELGERTLIMGILNVTPDSFSDGGMHATAEQAVAHALRLLQDGADILDIGGESTRPGAPALTSEAISAEEEQRRVLPVIEGVLRVQPDAIISMDTYRASTARLAIAAGAEIVNDVSGGLWDPAMFATCADLRCGLVVMHTRGLPSAWESQPPLERNNVVPSVLAGLRSRIDAALQAGVERERIAVDPGFGFGKRGEENWALLAGLQQMQVLSLPVLTGLSRKGFLDLPLQSPHAEARDRDDLTHVAGALAIAAGTHILRVHDVRGAIRAASLADAVSGLRSPALTQRLLLNLR